MSDFKSRKELLQWLADGGEISIVNTNLVAKLTERGVEDNEGDIWGMNSALCGYTKVPPEPELIELNAWHHPEYGTTRIESPPLGGQMWIKKEIIVKDGKLWVEK